MDHGVPEIPCLLEKHIYLKSLSLIQKDGSLCPPDPLPTMEADRYSLPISLSFT